MPHSLSRRQFGGLAAASASLIASEPASLNAISEESTEWYVPSYTVTRTPLTG